jgi:hypothetical protein
MIDMTQIGDTDAAEIRIKFDTKSDRDQALTVCQALGIFSEKNAKYNDGWRVYGTYGAAFFVKDRANRIWRMIKEHGTINEEDALDLINLCCFVIRSQRENNFGGEFWDPEDGPATFLDRAALKQNRLIREAVLDTSKGDAEIVQTISAILS